MQRILHAENTMRGCSSSRRRAAAAVMPAGPDHARDTQRKNCVNKSSKTQQGKQAGGEEEVGWCVCMCVVMCEQTQRTKSDPLLGGG
uniref:Uncharacterized protein n=1 Tax=Physcomitrium patens TaxID=3218 RepID=A0A2K1JDL6_PHYPA|nr:hypothetical protein PHYPA_019898 [Physcomitrium patens]